MSAFAAGIAIGLAAVLIAAATLKQRQFVAFRRDVSTWRLVPHRQAGKLARGIIAFERTLGITLTISVPSGFIVGAWVTALALALTATTFFLFTAVQVLLVARRSGASCGCFGSRSNVGTGSLVRASALSFAAVVGVVVTVPDGGILLVG